MENKLKSVREDGGLTQDKLAAMLKVSQRTISKWETGKSTPSIAQMQFLQDYFGIPKEDIFFGAINYKTLLKISVPTTENSKTPTEEVS